MFLSAAWQRLFGARHPDLPQFVAELRAMRVALYQLIAEAETALSALTVAEQTALRRSHQSQARERAAQAPRVLSQQRPEAPAVAKEPQRITAEEAAEDLRVLLYLPKLAQFRRPPDAPLLEVDTSRVLLAFAEAPPGPKSRWELVRCYDRATKRLGTKEHWDMAPESLLEPGERDTLRSVLQQGTAAQDRR